ncbi:kinase-like domain-containing protein [Tanacetum coccineum]
MSSPNHDDLAHLKVPLESILSATNNFAAANIIEEAYIGNAYKGELLWSGELIDIDARRFNKERGDEIEQRFWMEISMLSSLKHKNLVSLVGFCDESGEIIIITRYVTRGSLRKYLSDPMLLTWVRRLEICVSLAHALSYIHYDEQRDFSVIHQNIDSATILLNDNWEPKLCEFRLSMKIKASERHLSFDTSNVWNTLGYTDPTYLETKSAHHKSDMYPFGIVLFELLCGRKTLIDDDQDYRYLAPLAVTYYTEKTLNEKKKKNKKNKNKKKQKTLHKIIDPGLWKQMDLHSFIMFAEIAFDCLDKERSRRPDIDGIVPRLEKALELARENRPVRPLTFLFYASAIWVLPSYLN